MKLRYPLATLASAVVVLLHAQAPPTVAWQHNYGGSLVEHANAVVATMDNGFAYAGMSYSNNGDISGTHGSGDLWVVKTDADGALLWQHAYGGSGNDAAEALIGTADGGFIAVGSSDSSNGDVTVNHGGKDYWVVKISSSGALEWERSLGSTGEDIALDVALTDDGGCVVVGTAEFADGDVTIAYGLSDYWVVRLNSTGDIVWQKTLGGSSTDVATAVDDCADGGFIVAGYTASQDWDVTGYHGFVDYWVVKLSGQGGVEWKRTLGGGDGDYAYGVRQAQDGGYVVVGESGSSGGDVAGHIGSTDLWVVKLNSTGGLVWQRCLGGTDGDRGNDIQLLTNGDFLVVGSTDSHDGFVDGQHGGGDGWVARIGPSGDLRWQRACGGDASDFFASGCLTSDGGYVLAGSAISNNGDLTSNHGIYDCWLMKLNTDYVGIEERSPIACTISPNPTSDVLRIQFAGTPSRVDLQVFNSTGGVVYSAVGASSSTQQAIDVRAWPAGAYALRVRTGDAVRTMRFVKE